jgi:hypothetical protein
LAVTAILTGTVPAPSCADEAAATNIATTATCNRMNIIGVFIFDLLNGLHFDFLPADFHFSAPPRSDGSPGALGSRSGESGRRGP